VLLIFNLRLDLVQLIIISIGIEETVSHYENLICIGIKKNVFFFLRLNLVLFKIKKDKEIFIRFSYLVIWVYIKVYTVHDALY
jgi:hypothetical protein